MYPHNNQNVLYKSRTDDLKQPGLLSSANQNTKKHETFALLQLWIVASPNVSGVEGRLGIEREDQLMEMQHKLGTCPFIQSSSVILCGESSNELSTSRTDDKGIHTTTKRSSTKVEQTMVSNQTCCRLPTTTIRSMKRDHPQRRKTDPQTHGARTACNNPGRSFNPTT